ncbi:MAG: hypothetical protein RBT69_09985 [Spirochaetia bacterium]|nr:hypothetical protein [Spirochaetia bacterium]
MAKTFQIMTVSMVMMMLISCRNPDDSSIITVDQLNTTAPAAPVKICFIHHSTGSAWISSSNGGLGTALNNNNYYVTECDYGWDAELNDNLGDRTDTKDWPEWFTEVKMPNIYANNSHFDYPSNTISNPGGENEIIMFKSCYPNSEVGLSIDDEKIIYNGLLPYFAAHTDKMFVLVIPPPEIVIDSAPLTRKLSNWLVDRNTGWLAGYAYYNVYAFNYYNILTDAYNHHWVNTDGYEENIVTGSPADRDHPDELYYPTADDHPSAAGHQKATAELLPLLNGWYHLWKGN